MVSLNIQKSARNGSKTTVQIFSPLCGMEYPRYSMYVDTGLNYPGSELIVANTLAKWKKLEPNEIDFSQSARK